jgi:hypothetical protein
MDGMDRYHPHVLRGKTVVNMVNHDPFAARDLDVNVMQKYGIRHVSASLFGVPETVCTPGAHLLVSAAANRTAESSSSAAAASAIAAAPGRLSSLSPTAPLSVLGEVHEFFGDVGLASVVYLCLVQSLYFGLAGYELALLILTKYMSQETNVAFVRMGVDDDSGGFGDTDGGSESRTPNDGNDAAFLTADEILRRFQKLASSLLTTYLPAFLPIISDTINTQRWTHSYVPASAAIDLFDMHDVVFRRLGLFQDAFHVTYLKYLRRVVEEEEESARSGSGRGDDDEMGISAVVQHYSTDGFRIEQARNRPQREWDAADHGEL